tara:strand:- start:13 stop:222 length:210 start_codon:yes stop_codon:yes gene_type:complete
MIAQTKILKQNCYYVVALPKRVVWTAPTVPLEALLATALGKNKKEFRIRGKRYTTTKEIFNLAFIHGRM